MGSEILLGQQKFWSEIVLGQKKCGSKKSLGKKNLVEIFFLHESSIWVKIGLHAENQLPGWSGSGLKVFRWWWWWWVRIPIIESNQLYWLWLSWVLTISLHHINTICKLYDIFICIYLW